MVKSLAMLLVSASACFGQAFTWLDQAWLGELTSASVPASDPLSMFKAYWKPSATDYTTNAGTTTLADLRSGTYPLTNTAAAGLPTRVASGIDGQDYLSFDGTSDYLRQLSLTNAQPNETWLVMKYADTASGANVIADSADGANDQTITYNGVQFLMNAGTSVSISNVEEGLTNRWFMWRFLWNGASSYGKTNGVNLMAGNAGAQSAHGFTLGAAVALNFNSPIHVAWAGVVSSNLSDANANSVSNALKTLFPTAIP